MRPTVKIQAALLAVFLVPLGAAAQDIIDTVVGNYDPDGATATAVPLMDSRGVAIDSAGDFYVADEASNQVYKIDASGTLSIFAGNGLGGFSGDGGPAAGAGLSSPRGLAFDAADHLYIADAGNQRIRKVDGTGTITTVAGTGLPGFGGDGGPATSARLLNPVAVAVDAAGNLWIADQNNQRIRKVDPAGTITTIAGDGYFGYGGDGGPATSARLHSPGGVAVDASGNVLIADTYNQRIRKVDPAGIIATVAGNGYSGYAGDGGPATGARLYNPVAVAVDAAGNLWIADQGNQRIRKVDPAGIMTTVAGNGLYGFTGDGVPATGTRLFNPTAVAIRADGSVLIADASNYRIREVDPAGIISTIAGNGEARFFGDGTPALIARLWSPRGLATDAAGNLYIADTGNHRIRKVDPSGIITTVAGNGQTVDTGDGGPATSAGLGNPSGVDADAAGNVWIADTAHHRVRKVDPAGTITTVAGNGNYGFSGDGGPATSARLFGPIAVATDEAGNLWIADQSNLRIRKVDSAGIITTVAGDGSYGYSGDGGPATSARLSYTSDLAVDAAGNLWIVDSNNQRIRKVSPAGTITTVAGNGVYGYGGDGGPATGARLYYPRGLDVDDAGYLWIADQGNNRIRQVDATGTITTIAGVGLYGFSGDGGPATDARLAHPGDVAVRAGHLWIADANNDRIRRVTADQAPVCAAPSVAQAECAGASTVLGLDGTASADPDGGPLVFSWTTDCPGGSFDDATRATPSLTVTTAAAGVCGPLACSATLTVTDDGDRSDGCAPTLVSITDTSAPVIGLAGGAAMTLECAVDTFTDPGAAAIDACDPEVAVVAGGETVDPATIGTYLLTYDAADACGNAAAQAVRTVTVADTLAPDVVVDTSPILVTDTDCSGSEPVELPAALATDACDPAPAVGDDAPAVFAAGETTTVTYTATDASSNTVARTLDVTVLHGAGIAVSAVRHTVGNGAYPGSAKEPLVGIEVCGYSKAEGSCARDVCGGISHQHYQCIVDGCAPVNADHNAACCLTDADGECTINAPPGDYLVISADATKTVLPDPLGVSAGELVCGELKQKHLQQIVKADGEKVPAKTTRRTGSELLIIEPEFIEWSDVQALYPVVLESIGDWSVETSIEPPEGFVADYAALAEQVTNEVAAVQFTLTDVGSDWVPAETRYVLRHRGRREVVLSRIGVRLSEELARAKGLSRFGRPLDNRGRPIPAPGFDPRSPRPVEIVGWIEPPPGESLWRVKLRAEVPSELRLEIDRGRGQVVETLFAGDLDPGETELGWDSSDLRPGIYFLRLTCGEMVQEVKLAER